MSQEYYSVEKESNLGALNIGLSVFQAIVVKAVESVDGVQFEGNMIPMPGSGPVRTNINKNNQVIIDVDVLIDYGLNVASVTSALQNNIAQSYFEMTGIKNVKVNIEVKGINF